MKLNFFLFVKLSLSCGRVVDQHVRKILANNFNILLKESKLKDYFSKNFNLSPKCHFVTYYSHFRVLGNLAKIFGLNRGKTPKKNANFDFWSLISKFHNFRKPTFVKAWWRDVNESTNSCKFASCGNCKSEWLKSLEIILQIALVHGLFMDFLKS